MKSRESATGVHPGCGMAIVVPNGRSLPVSTILSMQMKVCHTQQLLALRSLSFRADIPRSVRSRVSESGYKPHISPKPSQLASLRLNTTSDLLTPWLRDRCLRVCPHSSFDSVTSTWICHTMYRHLPHGLTTIGDHLATDLTSCQTTHHSNWAIENGRRIRSSDGHLGVSDHTSRAIRL